MAETVIPVRGDIGSWENAISASWFIGQLERLDPEEPVRLRVNSDGGSAFEAWAMAAALHRHRGHITTEVEGLAASAATYLLVAADSIEIFEPALVMVHRASSGTIGNAEDMRQAADVLDVIDRSIAQSYASRSGGRADDWYEAMRAETWLNSSETASLFGAVVLPVKGPNVVTAQAAKGMKAITNRSARMRGLVNRLTSAPRPALVSKTTRAKLAEYAARIEDIRQREVTDARSYNRQAIVKNARTARQAKTYLGWS